MDWVLLIQLGSLPAYFDRMANETTENTASIDELNIKRKTRKAKLSIDEIIRSRIDKAIIDGDEKEARLQLEILEKYLKTAKPVEGPKKIEGFKARRAYRDKLMAQLLTKFEKLQENEN